MTTSTQVPSALDATTSDVVVMPTSPSQQRFWVLDQIDPDAAAYTIPVALRLRGALDVGALQRAFNAVIARHEVLRTTFALDGDAPAQLVRPSLDIELPVREADVASAVAANANASFDLATGPLVRAELLRVAPDEHVLLVALHHIVADGWSLGVLFRELDVAYDAFVAGREPELPALPLQYADYAVWQRRTLQGATVARQLAYWKERLVAPLPVLDLATDRPRPPVQTTSGGKRELAIDASLAEATRELARANGATPYIAFLSAFVALLHRYTSQTDLVVGSVTSGRRRAEVESLIGPFVNTLALRVDADGDPTFAELLGRVRETTLGALANQDVPFEQVVESVHPPRDLSRSPIFQAAFQLLDGVANEPRLAGLAVDRVPSAKDTTKFDLTLVVNAGVDGALRAVAEYNADLFDAATIERLLAHYRVLLAAAVRAPETPIARLPLMSADETARAMSVGNETDAPLSPYLLHERVRETIARRASAEAVRDGATAQTYEDLGARASRVAGALLADCVKPGARVAVCLDRTADIPAALLGILETGAAYVPLDPAHPIDRLALVLEDARPVVLLVHDDLRDVAERAIAAAGLTGADAPRVCTLEAALAHAPAPDVVLPPRDVEAPAYVLYTSGSTGKPKGVVVPHRAVVNFLDGMAERPGIGEDDTLLAVTTLSFDIAGLELWLPLVVGARVVIASADDVVDGARLESLLRAHDVTMMQATPATWRLLLEHGWTGDPRLTMLCGGEALPPDLADALVERGRALWNMYGPTETTIWSAVARIERGASITLGAPIRNTQLYVVDRALQPTPLGVPGELVIGGAGVALGYLGRPDLTAERFVSGLGARGPGLNDVESRVTGNDPSPEPRAPKLYRTGDLVRRRADDTLEFLGRLDHQIKLRGYRIELGEVEAALRAYAGVREAVALVRETTAGDKQLVGYYLSANGAALDESALRTTLRARLPEYMVPSALVWLERWPLTANGKIDRKALPAPDVSETTRRFVAPRTETEARVAEIVAAVLGRDAVGADDDFFELGGHSLLAMRVIARVNAAFGMVLRGRALFDAPTVAGLAAAIDHIAPTRAGESAVAGASIPRRGTNGPAPLSQAQELLWLHEQMTPGTAAYNVPISRRVRGVLDIAAFQTALDRVVARHEALRTTFVEVDGRPQQVVHAAAPVAIALHDLRAMPASERELAAASIAQDTATQPFDLATNAGPRVALVRVADDESVLVIVVHHIVFDGASIDVLLGDLTTAYEAAVERRALATSDAPLQQSDVAVWERGGGDPARRTAGEGFWREYLAAAPSVVDLPHDTQSSASGSLPAARVQRVLSTRLRDDVAAFARANAATPFQVLLAAFQVLLHRHSAQDDLVVGVPIDGRERAELQRTIGYLASTVPMRAQFGDAPGFATLVARLRDAALHAYDHAEASPRTPFNVGFVQQHARAATLAIGDATLEPYGVAAGAAKFELTLSVSDVAEGVRASLEYRSDLFAPETAERMIRRYEVLLAAALVEPNAPVATLPILDVEEQSLLLGAWAGAPTPYPRDASVATLFDAQVAATPNAIAVESGDVTLSYRELHVRARAAAHALRAMGVRRGDRVGIHLERSERVVVAMLAAVMAGAAYVPLDLAYPTARLAAMVDDAGLDVVLTERAQLAHLPTASLRPLVLDDITPNGDAWNDASGDVADGGDIAYVVYTSGSTGVPKGVQVLHRAITRLVRETDYVSLDATDVIAQVSNTSFDAATFEVWGALLNGARLVVIRTDVVLVPDAFARALAQHGVTTLFLTTALFNQIAQYAPHAFDGLRYVLFGGEAVDPRWVRAIVAHGGPRQLTHVYGPTEVTTFALWHAVDAVAPNAPTVPIGRPIANTTAYVLDTRGHLVPTGVRGELFLGGDGVAAGYLHRPELTAERFVDDPFAMQPGARLYRTGDIVRRAPDGAIEFVGRVDHQVKIRGFRIELGEIENALARHETVTAALVIVRTNAAGERELVAYVASPGRAVQGTALRSSLRTELPEFMVPTAIVVLDALPINANGKVDRAALPAPTLEDASDADFVAPRDELESVVASVWRDVLSVERVGAETRFLSLGGNSLLATRVAGQLTKIFRTTLPLRRFFEDPTVAGNARALASIEPKPGQAKAIARLFLDIQRRAPKRVTPQRGTAAVTDRTIRPRESAGPAPLSYAQELLWLYEQMTPGTPTYHVTMPRRVRGALDVARLERALTRVVERHEALRTGFREIDGEPQQIVMPATAQSIETHDLRELGRHAEAEGLIRLRDAAARPFDLSTNAGPRVVVAHVADDVWLLLVVVHHVVFDGGSVGLFFRDLAAAYESDGTSAEPWSATPPLQMADVATWTRTMLDATQLAPSLAFWREYLDGATAELDLPTDFRRSAARGTGARCALMLPATTRSAIQTLATTHRATRFNVLLAGMQALMYRYTGQDDLCIGVALSGRARAGTEGVVGYLVNVLPLRARFDVRTTFAALLDRVREDMLQVFEHGDVRYGMLMGELQSSRPSEERGLFRVLLTQQDPQGFVPHLGDASMQSFALDVGTSAFDISFSSIESPDGVRIAAEYRTDLFEESTIRRMVSHLAHLLESAAATPDGPVGTIEMLGDAERSLILDTWNETTFPIPDADRGRGMHEVIARRVAEQPDAPALTFEGTTWSYRELWARAHAHARRLAARGARPGHIVAAFAERSPDLVAALLGTWIIGASYLPIDAEYPIDRIAFMLEDANVEMVLTQRDLERRLPGTRVRYVHLDDPLDDPEDGDDCACQDAPFAEHAGDERAVVLFTSGSTGRPKGVCLPHRALVNHARWLASAGGDIGPNDTVLHRAPLSFDVATWELFGTLVAGARIAIARPGGHSDVEYTAQLMRDENVTIVQGVPSVMRMLLEVPAIRECHAWRATYLGGEAVTPDLVARLRDVVPWVHVYDGYGPTEATIDATWYEIPHGTVPDPIPIGRAMGNAQAYVLSAQGALQPIGVPGELYIGGAGVATGYLERPELTAERFLPDPFSPRRGARMYRTGDRVRWRGDGQLEYLGRIDQQVKLRGVRIELEEIESALRSVPGVSDAAVRVHAGPAGDQLVAYFVADPSASVDVAALRATAEAMLPPSVVPSTYLRLDVMPLSPNGKTDRKALPEPNELASATYVAPRGDLETVVASVWSAVLQRPNVGVETPFFELGGHSLLATRIAGQLTKIFRTPLPLRRFFEQPTVAGNARALASLEPKPGLATTIAKLYLQVQQKKNDSQS